MSPSTIRRCDKSLVEKEYMTIIRKAKEGINQFSSSIDSRYYHFVKYNEAVCDAIISHEERITDNTERINNLEKKLNEQNNYIAKLEKELYDKQTKEKEIIL